MAKMAKNYCIDLLFIGIFLQILLVECQPPLAPALYIFGDSLSDAGNNNFLQTTAKVNYKPYGIDFPTGFPTGRFCNGKLEVDFMAQSLGLPLVPAYLSLSPADKRRITTGVNYASGAGGILPETGSATGEVLSFDDQINYFQDTVVNYLLRTFSSKPALAQYLSKSIFWISIGNNDYINNYLQPASYSSSRRYTPQQYADLLIMNLKIRITRLYLMGARKFVVFNVGRLGCVPAIVNTANPRPTTPCVEDINDLVLLFNTRFRSLITSLEHALVGSTFVRGDSYSLNKTSAEIGFTTQQIPCCQVSSSTGLCIQDSIPCPDRTVPIFWDAFHTTQAVNRPLASECFSGSSRCTPLNVQQLAQK